MEFVAEEWMHECERTAKRDGIPKFDGSSWVCSRCSLRYSVNRQGCTQEQAEKMFWSYLAGVGFKRRQQDAKTGEIKVAA